MPTQELQQVRSLMKEHGIDAYIVYCADKHNSEYTGYHDKRLGFISGFTGSAGTGFISQDVAYLWTDGRYFEQANRQLKDGWNLMEMGMPKTPTLIEYINSYSSKTKFTLGIDTYTTTMFDYLELKTKLKKKVSIKTMENDLITIVWADKQPAQTTNPIYVHPMNLAGYSTSNKIKDIQNDLKTNSCDALVISALDEIAWLMNMRGSDVIYNPLFYAFVMITTEEAIFFVNKSQLTVESLKSVEEANIKLMTYDTLASEVKKFSENNSESVIWMDPRTCLFIHNSVISADNVYLKQSPIAMYKAIKNEAELEGIRQAHIRDGIAHIRFFQWLESVKNDKSVFQMSEVILAEKIEYFRSIEEGYLSLGFPTISAIGVNAALPHYNYPKTEKDDISIKPAIYLLDAGTQYFDGTCDITRTIHLGEPTLFEKQAYTNVLKGHIEFANAIFPEKTKGPQIDTFARMHLWKAGLNYIHGTGHGIGAALSVHEGPMKVDVKLYGSYIETDIIEGMVLSNEPGYYDVPNKLGIRIENTVFVVEAKTPNNYAGLKFFGFDTISYIPIDTEMILTSEMTQTEIDWLNSYHQDVYDHLNARLDYEEKEKKFDNTSIKAWLKEKTQPIYK